jgi:hypothetical protein
MKMSVTNRLTGRLSNIDAEVVAVRHPVCLDVTPNCWHKRQDRDLFFLRKGEEIRLVTTWYDETVFLIQWKGVWESHGEVVQGDEISAG